MNDEWKLYIERNYPRKAKQKPQFNQKIFISDKLLNECVTNMMAHIFLTKTTYPQKLGMYA